MLLFVYAVADGCCPIEDPDFRFVQRNLYIVIHYIEIISKGFANIQFSSHDCNLLHNSLKRKIIVTYAFRYEI